MNEAETHSHPFENFPVFNTCFVSFDDIFSDDHEFFLFFFKLESSFA